MGISKWIKDWWHRARKESLHRDEEAAYFDNDLEKDRVEAEQAKEKAQDELAEVREMRPQSREIKQRFDSVKEENHFSDWLFALPPRRRTQQ